MSTNNTLQNYISKRNCRMNWPKLIFRLLTYSHYSTMLGAMLMVTRHSWIDIFRLENRIHQKNESAFRELIVDDLTSVDNTLRSAPVWRFQNRILLSFDVVTRISGEPTAKSRI